MTKTISLILVTLFAVACGGEPFAADAEFNALPTAGAANEAGASDVTPTAGYAGSGGSHSSGGSSSQGGVGVANSGTTNGGSVAVAGSSSAAGSATAGAPSCEFDAAKVTAALPKSLVWKDYMYTEGKLCTTCRDSPCDTVNVISWGAPQVMSDGRLQYLPNTDQPMVPMNFGANDGSCTRELECGVKFGSNMQLVIEVVQTDGGWVISTSEVSATILATAACKNAAGEVVRSLPMGADFGSEIDMALAGLKIPCN